jgi:hypothetical protein
MSLFLMTYALIVSALLLVTNIFTTKLPWMSLFSNRVTMNIAIFGTVIIGISLVLFPLTYETKIRPRLMYLLLTIMLIFGSFYRIFHQKAPFLNGMIMVSSIIGYIAMRLILKKGKGPRS